MTTAEASILIVDDEPRILRSLKATLKGRYSVHVAQSGAEAKQFLQSTPVDMVISDQRMPELQGHELLGWVSQKIPNSVRILMTACAEISDIQPALDKAGVVSCVYKPWDPDKLNLLLEKALSQRPKSAPHRNIDTVENSGFLTDIAVVTTDSVLETICSALKPDNGGKVHMAELADSLLRPGYLENVGVLFLDHGESFDRLADTLSELKKFRPTLVTVVVTRGQDGRYIENMHRAGQVHRYVVKPISQKRLELTLDSAFKEHQQRVNPLSEEEAGADQPSKRFSARGFFQKLGGI